MIFHSTRMLSGYCILLDSQLMRITKMMNDVAILAVMLTVMLIVMLTWWRVSGQRWMMIGLISCGSG